MSLSQDAIDRIVANVLTKISPDSVRASVALPTVSASVAAAHPVAVTSHPEPVQTGRFSLSSAVITAELLEPMEVSSTVTVRPKAIVTPAAWDVVKSRKLRLERGTIADGQAASNQTDRGSAVSSPFRPLLIVVRSGNVVNQLWESIATQWNREILGCPDDAAKLAISAVCRGDASTVVILAEQTFRAACLANRNEKIKAVAIQESRDVKIVRTQIRANVWCLDPTNSSFFELKNLIQQIQQEAK
ncbi:hypothetical protein SH668x_003308 [Planctomicrobium sp. SH668]|uniref:hypothetical protein n=1 Tax=Planctomicrobium sp. SH668 TaxID=3448126 RepID=UPI003F5B1C0E